ncbi:hypothetical protein BMETH_2597235366905, partial [methanotrophic bacterial endosymbiont of Bathymodiolus sp.]
PSEISESLIIKPSSVIPERMLSLEIVVIIVPLCIEGHDKTTDF